MLHAAKIRALSNMKLKNIELAWKHAMGNLKEFQCDN